jgi:hypothetical protein
MPHLRYFGIDLGEGAIDPARADTRLGQFVAWAEPLPVGSAVEIEGVIYEISRVDEGLAPGVWLKSENQTLRDIPLPVEAESTTPSPPPVVIDDLPAPTAAEGPPTIVMQAVAPPSDEPPPAAATSEGDSPTEPEPEPEGGGRRRRRKPRKTMMGR